jgi:hypothetical protein
MKEYFKLFEKYNIKNFKGSYFNADGTSKIKNYYGFIPKEYIYNDKHSIFANRFLNITDLLHGGSSQKNINLSIFKNNLENKIEYGNDFMFPIDNFEKINTESEYKNDLINVINKINYIFDKTTEDLITEKVALKQKITEVKKMEQKILNKEQLQFLIKILSLVDGIRKFLNQELDKLKTYDNYIEIINKYSSDEVKLALQMLNKDETNKLKDLITNTQIPSSNFSPLPLYTPIKVTGGNINKEKYIKYKTKYLKLKNKKINMT